MFIKSNEFKFTLIFVLATIIVRITGYIFLITPNVDSIIIDIVGIGVSAILVFYYFRTIRNKKE